MRSHRVLIGILAVIAVVAVLGAVVANSRQLVVDPNSPEGVVQSYLGAVLDGDGAKAVRYLDPAGKCTEEDIDRYRMTDVTEARLVDVADQGTSVKVVVDLEMGGNGLMGDVWRDRQTFYVKDSNGAWVITGTPWPMYDCGGVLK